jgi:hydrogenase maturation protease
MKRQDVKQTLILGLGNSLLGDEGIGVHVAHEIQRHLLPGDVEVIDGGTCGLALLSVCRGRKRVIIVDAMDVAAEPGSVFRFTPDQAGFERNLPRSAHDGGCSEFLEGLERFEDHPEIVIVGVVPATLNTPSLELSPALQRQLPIIVSTVLCEASLEEQNLPDEG